MLILPLHSISCLTRIYLTKGCTNYENSTFSCIQAAGWDFSRNMSRKSSTLEKIIQWSIALAATLSCVKGSKGSYAALSLLPHYFYFCTLKLRFVNLGGRKNVSVCFPSHIELLCKASATNPLYKNSSKIYIDKVLWKNHLNLCNENWPCVKIVKIKLSQIIIRLKVFGRWPIFWHIRYVEERRKLWSSIMWNS